MTLAPLTSLGRVHRIPIYSRRANVVMQSRQRGILVSACSESTGGAGENQDPSLRFGMTNFFSAGFATGRMLAAGGEARGQAGGEVRGEDPFLRGFQIVGCAMEVDDLGVRIKQRESGAPVSVTRLSDRAWINHVTRVRLQLQRDGLSLPDRAIFRTEAIGTRTVGEESALQVSVAEEGQRRGECEQRHQRVADRND